MTITVQSRTENRDGVPTITVRVEWAEHVGRGIGRYNDDEFDLPAVGPLADAKPGDRIEMTIRGAEG